jgi:phosphatidylserine decarboxylase
MKDKITYIFHAPDLLLIVASFAFLGYRLHSKVFAFLAAIGLCFLLFFFRPAGVSSTFAASPETIYSPAQGTIQAVIKGPTETQISIYLSPLDVHVQYAPTTAKVLEQSYKTGTFHAAKFFEKSQYNERMETTFMTANGPIRVAQIAGQLARRIESFVQPGQQLSAGEPFGLIKLGSRVDVFLPAGAVPLVSTGDSVYVTDPIARF